MPSPQEMYEELEPIRKNFNKGLAMGGREFKYLLLADPWPAYNDKTSVIWMGTFKADDGTTNVISLDEIETVELISEMQTRLNRYRANKVDASVHLAELDEIDQELA